METNRSYYSLSPTDRILRFISSNQLPLKLLTKPEDLNLTHSVIEFSFETKGVINILAFVGSLPDLFLKELNPSKCVEVFYLDYIFTTRSFRCMQLPYTLTDSNTLILFNCNE